MIAVVDYCKGNLKSVERGLRSVGGDARIVDDPARIAEASAIVLPGVGAFADASDSMMRAGQMQAVRDAVERGVPFLGICLGLHLMFEEGTEGSPEEDDDVSTHNAPGLAILPGVAGRMPSHDELGRHYKVPHVGWNSIERTPECDTPLLDGIDDGEFFYFTHSYIAPENSATQATTTHSIAFPSVVDYNHTAFGVQFHPEKSSDAGLHVLKNFLSIVDGAC